MMGLFLLTASSGSFRVKAQGANLVFDFQSFAQDMAKYFEQADQWVAENENAAQELFHIEEMKGWVDKYFGDGSTWQTIMKKARTTRDLAELLGAVNYSTESYLAYTKYLSQHMDEMDPSVTARMMRRTSDLYNRVKLCYEAALDLLSDDNANYGDKVKGVKDAAKAAIGAANEMNEELDSTIDGFQSTSGAITALGILDGLNESQIRQAVKSLGGSKNLFGILLSAYGETGPSYDEPRLDPVEEGSVKVRDVLDSKDAPAMRSGVRNAFKLISVVLALMMAGMLVIVLIKWSRGEYGAGDYGERGFLTVFVAIIVVCFVLSLLTGYIGFGLGS